MRDKFYPAHNAFVLSTAITAVSTGHGNIPRQAEETFEQWLQKNQREYPVTLDLPPEIVNWIGVISAYWALAEWMELGILARLTKMERKEMRVFLGASRAGGATSKIRELIRSKDISVTIDIDKLCATLNDCEKARNLLGHGVWLIDPITNELCVENPSGEWKQPKEQTISRRKYPQAFHPTQIWVVQVFSDIKLAIRELQNLDQEITAALVASPHKAG